MHDQSGSELINSIAAKKTEQFGLLRQLAMWAEVKRQGIDPETVETFGFDPKLMTPEELKAVKLDTQKRLRLLFVIPGNDNQNPFGWPIETVDGKRTIRTLRYNFVRLKTGERVKLSPMIDRPDAISESAN